MPKLERLLFDLIESVSVDERSGDFSQALVSRIMKTLAEPMRIAAVATLKPRRSRYEPVFTQGTPVWQNLDGLLSARTVQRRLEGQLWWIQRGIRCDGAEGEQWLDLIVIPIDRDLNSLLGIMTESMAGEEGNAREESFQAMGQLLRLFVDRHQQRSRLQEILTLAGQQQLSLLPVNLPRFPGYSIAAHCVPAEEVGGDYYQAFPLTYAAGGFAIADAKGKGFEAAMQVTGLHAGLRVVNETPFKLAHRVGLLNRSLVQGGELRNLISLFLAEWDSEGRLLYVNCSHPPPLWVRSGGRVKELSEGGHFLGLAPQTTYRFGIAELEPGDLVVAYTDGWSEVFNEQGQEFGAERLRSLFSDQHGAELPALIERLQSAADAFRGEIPFNDDRTLVVLRKD